MSGAEESNHMIKITAETNPDEIMKVGGAIVYILKSHNIPTTPTEVFKNSERIVGESLLHLSTYDIFPGSISIFRPEDRNYFSDTRNYRNRLSSSINKDCRKNVYHLYENIINSRETRLTAVGIIDARECSQHPCAGSVYAFEYPVSFDAFEMRIRDRTCPNNQFKSCGRELGAVVGSQVVDINLEE